MRSFQSRPERIAALGRRSFVRHGALALTAALGASLSGPAAAKVPNPASATSRGFTTSDGVRLHYLEAGGAHAASGGTLLLVPGWTMPAWIWGAQIEHFATRMRVIAFDPRGQGDSEIARTGYDYARRAADIAELLAAAQCEEPVVLVGWSLGVLECLQFMHDTRQAGTPRTRALVLVDNSVGVGDPPAGDPTLFTRLRAKRRDAVSGFVASMFKRPVDAHWQSELVEAALRTPLQASIDLLRQARPREFWRDSLYATTQPVLYAHTSKFAQQAQIVKASASRKGSIDTQLYADAGHALFVDEAAAFNERLERFIGRTLATRSGAPR
jgi:microsomal epoxide hydrolase